MSTPQLTSRSPSGPAPWRGLIFFLAASLAVHVALFWALGRLPPISYAPVRKPIIVEVVQVKRAPPPPPEEAKPKPKVKPPPVRVAKVDRTPPPPREDAPPPPNQQAPEDAKPAPIVVGLTLSSTTTAGSFAAPVGNTLYGKSDKEGQDPSQVKGYSAKKYVPAYQVDTAPEMSEEFKPPYPAEAKRDDVEGVVTLKVSLDETGKVTDVKVLNGPGHGLNEAARQALYRFKFKPAVKGGESVATDITYRFRFELPPSL